MYPTRRERREAERRAAEAASSGSAPRVEAQPAPEQADAADAPVEHPAAEP
ncbi:M23 family peptidase, partial [Clavibacter lycopersici]